MTESFLHEVEHRPWPMPQSAWRWRQRWDHVLLLHYRVEARALAPFVPAPLEIEEHSGSAWVSIVPFRMLHVRPRYLPALSFVSDFAELNVRTYVRHGERPGVWFLRIAAGKHLSTMLARWFSPLPYEYAPMSFRVHGDGVSFRSPALDVDFRDEAPLDEAQRESLDDFLSERYCMYAATERGVVRADVHHVRWPLFRPRFRISRNELLDSLPVEAPWRPDRAHYSPGVEIVGWPPSGLSVP